MENDDRGQALPKATIAWTIEFNPAWLDRHEVEGPVRLVSVDSVGTIARVWAIRRDTEEGALYEPLYARHDDEEAFACVCLGDEDRPEVGDEIELGEPLPSVAWLTVLGEQGWARLPCEPKLVRVLRDEEGETGEIGLALGYSLRGVQGEIGRGFSGDLGYACAESMRRVYTAHGIHYEPMFFLWTY